MNTRIRSIWHRPLAEKTPDSNKCIDHEVIGIGEVREEDDCLSFLDHPLQNFNSVVFCGSQTNLEKEEVLSFLTVTAQDFLYNIRV